MIVNIATVGQSERAGAYNKRNLMESCMGKKNVDETVSKIIPLVTSGPKSETASQHPASLKRRKR